MTTDGVQSGSAQDLIAQFNDALLGKSDVNLAEICTKACSAKVCLNAPRRVLSGDNSAIATTEELQTSFDDIAAGNYTSTQQDQYQSLLCSSYHGKTALMCAAEHGHESAVRFFLLQLGYVSDNVFQETALHLALKGGHDHLIPYLLPEASIGDSYGRNALHLAASIGRLEAMDHFMDLVGSRDSGGSTALMLAAANNYPQCVEKLLGEQGETNGDGETALVLAMRARNKECVKLLEGEIGHSGITSLIFTAALGDEARLAKFLLEPRAAALAKSQDSKGRTALMYAMESGMPIAICEPLLAKEADIPMADGTPPICIAIQRDLTEYIHRLRHQCAVPNKAGEYPLCMAARYGWCDSIVLLLDLKESDADNAPWIHSNPHILSAAVDTAICTRSYGALSTLLKHIIKMDILQGVVVHERTGSVVSAPTNLMRSASKGKVHGVRANLHEIGCIYQGKTALMVAAASGHTECVKLLLCELGIVSEDGMTALDYACEYGDLTCVKYLSLEASLMKGEPLYRACIGDSAWLSEHKDALTYRSPVISRTLLMSAAACGQTSIIPLLALQIGEHDATELTALGLAAQRNQSTAIAELKEELDLPQSDGMTPLMVACKHGSYDVAKILISLAYPNAGEEALSNRIVARDRHGKTALMHAAIAGKRILVRELMKIESGAQDSDGKTALMYAVKHGHINLYELLAKNAAEIRLRDSDGKSALMYAVKHKRNLAIEVLTPIEKGLRDNKQQTALMHAVMGNRKKYVRILGFHEGGMLDSEGRSALSLAVTLGLFSIMRCLLSVPSERSHANIILEEASQTLSSPNDRITACLNALRDSCVKESTATIE